MVARSPTASNSEVLPDPFGPCMTVTPADGTNSALSKHLKSVIHSCFSAIWLSSRPDAAVTLSRQETLTGMSRYL